MRAVAGLSGFGGQRTARPTFITQGRDDVREKIRRHTHIGVTGQNQIVLRKFLKLNEFGHLGIRPSQALADHQLCVLP